MIPSVSSYKSEIPITKIIPNSVYNRLFWKLDYPKYLRKSLELCRFQSGYSGQFSCHLWLLAYISSPFFDNIRYIIIHKGALSFSHHLSYSWYSQFLKQFLLSFPSRLLFSLLLYQHKHKSRRFPTACGPATRRSIPCCYKRIVFV